MTSEEWIANIPSEQDRKYAREAVNAAIESEREGEEGLPKEDDEAIIDSNKSEVKKMLAQVNAIHLPVASGLEDRTSKLVGRLRELLKDRKYCFYDPAENVTYPMTSIIGAISEILADYDKGAK